MGYNSVLEQQLTASISQLNVAWNTVQYKVRNWAQLSISSGALTHCSKMRCPGWVRSLLEGNSSSTTQHQGFAPCLTNHCYFLWQAEKKMAMINLGTPPVPWQSEHPHNSPHSASFCAFPVCFGVLILNWELWGILHFCAIFQRNIQDPSRLAILKNLLVRQNTGPFLK